MLSHPYVHITVSDDFISLHFAGGFMKIDGHALLTTRIVVPKADFTVENLPRYREIAEQTLDEAAIALNNGSNPEDWAPRQVSVHESGNQGPVH